MKEASVLSVRTEFLKIVLGIGLLVGLGVFIRYYHLGFWGVWSLLLAFGIVISLLLGQFSLKNVLKSAIVLFIIMKVYTWLGKYGFLGAIVTIVLIIIMILVTRWKQYMKVKWHMETMLWGKPIKEYVSAGKPLPKLRIKL